MFFLFENSPSNATEIAPKAVEYIGNIPNCDAIALRPATLPRTEVALSVLKTIILHANCSLYDKLLMREE